MADNAAAEQRCDRCRFWQRVQYGDLMDFEANLYLSDELDERDPAAGCVGYCRRYPPAVLAPAVEEILGVMVEKHNLRVRCNHVVILESSTFWPVTWQDDWCGEFQPT